MNGFRKIFLLASCTFLLAGSLQAQFDDTFNTDPLQNGWIFNGVATWVPPDAPACLDPNTFDTLDPCTLYEGADDGYILVTYPGNTLAGNAFRAQKDSYDNFKMEVG